MAFPAESDAFVVRVEPAGLEIKVGAGEALMQAAIRQGYRWPTICEGRADCGVCFVRVREGEDQLSPRLQEETDLLGEFRPTKKDPAATRLACRLFVHGDGVVVFRPGVR
jgi:ferredoxin